jgi:tetratricopeptide (TPR) repeat protein
MNDQNHGEASLQEEEGKELYTARKFQQASIVFSQAAELYLKQEKEQLAAEMRNNQCVALLQAKQPREALAAVQGTALIFKEAGDQLKQAMAFANEATALKDLGQKSEAIEKFTQAADLFTQLNEGTMHLEVMQSISALKMKSRNLTGALFSMQDGLEQVEKPTLRQKLLINLLKIPQNLMEK